MLLVELLNGRKYQELVKLKGELPALVSHGAYPLYYIAEGYQTLCSECATKRVEDVTAHDIHWEGAPMICDDCSVQIESAFGELEEEE